MGCHRAEGVNGEPLCLFTFQAHSVSWLVIVELEGLGRGQRTLAVSEDHVNIRYGSRRLIQVAVAHIYDYVSPVTLDRRVVDIAIEVVTRHTDK